MIPTLDEANRPKAPEIEGVTSEQHHHGRRLAVTHRLHLQQVAQVEDVIRQTAAGHADLIRASEAVADLKTTANYRLFSNLCGREFLHLTFHHTSDDEHIFPALMCGSEGLRRVIQRLPEQHAVIHALLERLEAQAIALLDAPEQESFVRLKETFGQLASTVRLHFGYEKPHVTAVRLSPPRSRWGRACLSSRHRRKRSSELRPRVTTRAAIISLPNGATSINENRRQLPHRSTALPAAMNKVTKLAS
ncbi:hemerythrin domain-containing protein [Agrobacterium sp. 22-209-1]